jgi:hypothetical protein
MEASSHHVFVSVGISNDVKDAIQPHIYSFNSP